MSQTNVDYLFQMIAPTADRPPGLARSGSDGPGFDNHLSQASLFDATRPLTRSDRPSSQLPSDDHLSRTSYSSSTKSSRPNSSESSAGVAGAPSQNTTPATCDTGEDDCQAHDADDDAIVTDKHDDQDAVTTAAAQAGAQSNTVQKDHDTRHRERNAANKTNATAATTEAEKNRGQHGKSAEAADKTDQRAIDAKAGAAASAVAESAETAAVAVAEPLDTTNDEAAVETEKEGAARSDAKRKTNQSTAATDKQHVNGASAMTEGANNPDATATTGAVAVGQQPKATLAVNGAEEKSSDDDSRFGEKAEARTDGKTDVAPQPGKQPVAPVVSNVVATPSAPNGDRPKQDSDKTVKPASAKTETSIGPLGRAMRANSEITRGSRSDSTGETPTVDPARFVSRVSKALQTAHDRGGSLQLRLSPSELGAVKLQISVKDGVMNASLETESASARRVLLEHLPALRDRLAEQNIRIERFDVDVQQENNGGQASPQGFNQSPHQSRPEPGEPRRQGGPQRPATVATSSEPATPVARISNTEINLVV